MTNDSLRSCRFARCAWLPFAALVALLGDIQGATAAESAATVDISQFKFGPQELTVAPGTTVVWINRDQTIHNVVTRAGTLASPGLDTDDRYSFAFDHEGDYPYYCSLHPQMVGIVHVRGH
jgi:plastocyanin